MVDKVMTPEFRASYANVWEPRAMDEKQEKKYSLMMVFPKGADLSALKKAAAQVLIDKFGADQAKWPKNLRSPFRDQGDKIEDPNNPGPYVPGATFISASSKQKPGIVDAAAQPIIDTSEFYSGCYARATIRPFYYDNSGNKGVSFGLQNIQKLRDGEPLGGVNTPATKDFEAVSPPAGAAAGASADSVFG